MSDVQQRLNSAQLRIDALNSEKIRAEANYEAAKRDLKAILTDLKDEFGVTSVAELKSKIEDLERQVSEGIARVEKELDAVGG